MYFNALLEMYGLNPEDYVENFDLIVEDDVVGKQILLGEKPKLRICPVCGSKCNIHTHYLTKKIFHPNSSFVATFVVNRIQYKCKSCGKTSVFPLRGIADKYKNISFNQICLYNDFKDSLTFTYIAKKHGLSRARTLQLFDEMYPEVERNSFPKIMCIDEIRCQGYLNSPYVCILMDFETSNPVDIIGSRTKEYLDNYFIHIPPEELAKTKYIISDMFEGYKRIAIKFFPNAHHVVDRFHVIQLLSRAVNKIRTMVMKCYFKEEIEYRFMKTHWKIFLIQKNKIPNRYFISTKHNLEIHFDELVYRCLHLDNRFLIAWGAYQDLLNIPWGQQTYKNAEESLERIINTLNSSNIDELTCVAETYKQFKTSILMGMAKNQLNFKLTNDRMECLNNHIKTIKKDAYGYINFNRFRRRILTILRNRKHHPN